VALQVRLACRRLGVTRPVCIVTIPTAIDVVERMDVADIWYYRSDNHRADPGVDRDLITTYEDRLFARATTVLYSSRALMNAESQRHNGKAIFFDQGIDAELFSVGRQTVEPADLAAIAHPRIGYYGQLEPHGVDMELMVRTARDIPEANLVLVGNSAVDTSELAALKNVHLLGAKPHSEIPSYGHGFDVAIMPRPESEWSQSSNPIKLKEYLALGLPVVSTWLPELDYYKDVVRVGRTSDEFVDAIRATLADGGSGTVESRQQRVAGATWANRAAEIIATVRATRDTKTP
jgi:glycosyltransferase involved in cell wall biosynthesis